MALNLPFRSSQSFYLAPSRFSASKPTPSTFLKAHAVTSTTRVIGDHNSHGWKKMTPEKIEIIKSVENWMEEAINQTFLKPVESLWQPQDILPNPSSSDEEFFESIKEIRARTLEVPDDFFVCLVGNMITEEALPTYQTALNTFDGVRDPTGASDTAWARWTRRWTAEENRHGDLLNKYLYLSGRVDMCQIERTIQYLIGAGMLVGGGNNAFCGLVYTSFQERATFISHGNTARHAKHHGDTTLAKICGLIAADEKRHEMAYTKIVEKLFEIDPNTMMFAFAYMMEKRITMPARFMSDGRDSNLFDHYSMVTQKIGVYTAKDYADMVEFFVSRWNVAEISGGLSPEGRRAQEYVCGLAERFKKMQERAMERKKGKENPEHMIPFSWIFNRKVTV